MFPGPPRGLVSGGRGNIVAVIVQLQVDTDGGKGFVWGRIVSSKCTRWNSDPQVLRMGLHLEAGHLQK